VQLHFDMSAIEGGYMPKGGVAICPEGMPCVRRDYDDVSRFGNYIDALDAVDAASLVYDEHFTAGMAMLAGTAARRVVADRHADRPKIVFVAVDEPNRSAWRVLERGDIRCLDQRASRLDHCEASSKPSLLGEHILPVQVATAHAEVPIRTR
jgi:hypothetical protein